MSLVLIGLAAMAVTPVYITARMAHDTRLGGPFRGPQAYDALVVVVFGVGGLAVSVFGALTS